MNRRLSRGTCFRRTRLGDSVEETTSLYNEMAMVDASAAAASAAGADRAEALEGADGLVPGYSVRLLGPRNARNIPTMKFIVSMPVLGHCLATAAATSTTASLFSLSLRASPSTRRFGHRQTPRDACFIGPCAGRHRCVHQGRGVQHGNVVAGAHNHARVRPTPKAAQSVALLGCSWSSGLLSCRQRVVLFVPLTCQTAASTR